MPRATIGVAALCLAACAGDLPDRGTFDRGGLTLVDGGGSSSETSDPARDSRAPSDGWSQQPDWRTWPSPDLSRPPADKSVPKKDTGGSSGRVYPSCTGSSQCPSGWDCLGIDYKCHPRCTPPTDACLAVSNCEGDEACMIEFPGAPDAWCVKATPRGNSCNMGSSFCVNGSVCASYNGSAMCRPVCSPAGSPCGTGGTCLGSSGGCQFCSVAF